MSDNNVDNINIKDYLHNKNYWCSAAIRQINGSYCASETIS